ncbi:MAG: DUF4244 domain-containing protein [Propionibacteriaceae bacterium]|jgi:hypothetical protein|nr:DUF4244 domain-containing protein [Propionibacteriaceae bacterium]
MRKLINKIRHRKSDQRGMTTAEYAVGTVATVSLAGGLISIIGQDWFQDLMKGIIDAIAKNLLGWITGIFGG